MSRANEVYNYDRMIRREVELVQARCGNNAETILRYHKHSVARGLSLARITKITRTLRQLSTMLGKRWEDATKDDMMNLVAKIEQRDIRLRTKQDFKRILKQFYRWMKDADASPPEVRWIRIGNEAPCDIKKKDLLTTEEANQIVNRALTIQDKALFSVLFDSGRRFGEIIGLTVGDVEFDELGARLNVDGKVGKDIVRICASAPRLALWLDNHPAKDDPRAPLWMIWKKGRVKQLPYSAARVRLKDTVARAGIKKRVWFYLFRHSRITPASTKLTYSELCHVFGWKQGSDMPQFYVHLAGEDRDSAFLKMNGMQPKSASGRDEGAYAPQLCPRCKKNNSPDAKFCDACGLGLDLKHTVGEDLKEKNTAAKLSKLSDMLSKKPEVMDLLLNAASMLERSELAKASDEDTDNGDEAVPN